MNSRQRLNLLRAALLLTLILLAAGLYRFAQPVYASGLLLQSGKWQLFIGLGILATLLNLILLLLTWTPLGGRPLAIFAAGLARLKPLGRLNFVLFAAFIAGLALLVYGRLGVHLQGITIRLALFWLVALAGGVLLKAGGFERNWAELLGAALLLTGLGYKLGSYLPDVSTYPFTLGWSEASRFYYASLYFSERIYSTDVPPTVLHPSRYLLQAVPFLLPDSPLWLHRLWQVLLWIGTTGLSAWLLSRRLALPDRLRRWTVIAWAFMFLLLGPVYYHLQVPVILVLWLYDSNRFWRSLGVVLLASAWAGISRVNWFPVPAMLATALYFIESPVQYSATTSLGKWRDYRSLLRYLTPPVLWGGLGVAVAFAAQALYASLSGNPAEQFTSSFTSDLLWYRLFPNPTYPLGILPASLLVTLPLFLLVLYRMRSRWRAYHPIRLLGLAAMLLVLFAGGLVVSTKIGGGSNLHNLDAYLVLLMVVAACIYFERFCPDWPERETASGEYLTANRALHQSALALALLIPLYFTLDTGGPISYYPAQQTQEALETIRSHAGEVAQAGGEVLFISERQLLTFQELQGVKLVPEYEKVFLMEMAMAGNPNYLGRFRNDLQQHRFGLIISEPLFTREKGREEIFGEENDAWVKQVSRPVLCYYRPRKSLLSGVPIQLLVPRQDAQGCP